MASQEEKKQAAMGALLAWLTTATPDATYTALHDMVANAIASCEHDADGGDELHSMLLWLLAQTKQGVGCQAKWARLVSELQRVVAAPGDTSSSMDALLVQLSLRFPMEEDTSALLLLHGDKRLSEPPLRTASSLEPLSMRSARMLRRALTTTTDGESTRRTPLLDRMDSSSRRGRGASGAATGGGGGGLSARSRVFLRHMSTMLHAQVEETFFCFICFENVPLSQGFCLATCSHQYCRECLDMYLAVKIGDGDVYPACFHDTTTATTEDATTSQPTSQPTSQSKNQPTNQPTSQRTSHRRVACGVRLDPEDIQAIVSPFVWEKYERFKFNKQFEHARQCPYCGHSQQCAGPEDPLCVCDDCQQMYCFTHSNAHPQGTCADFERQNMETEKINRTAIARIAKPCPGCQSNVEKNGGCNHMTCIACETSFCWICGEIVESVAAPTHFAWWNLSQCAGQQLVDVDQQTRGERIAWLGCRVVHLFVCVPIAVVLTAVLTVVTGGCLVCICWLHEDPRAIFLGVVDKIAVLIQFALILAILGPISLLMMVLRWVRRQLRCMGKETEVVMMVSPQHVPLSVRSGSVGEGEDEDAPLDEIAMMW